MNALSPSMTDIAGLPAAELLPLVYLVAILWAAAQVLPAKRARARDAPGGG
jgi:hypothetical protein